MITDINNLDQLLTHYESEVVLIGPLLSLSINASYRYFHVAGNGSKVYQSIGLGFLENKSHAQKQRADIIEKLKLRFVEVVLFDSHREMARAARARWLTEETARVFATAEKEAKAASAPKPDYKTINERGDEQTLQGEQLLARELLEQDQSTPRVRQTSPTDGTSVAEERRPITLNQGDQLPAEPAIASERTKMAGQESPKRHSHQKGLTSNYQFRELAGTLCDDSLDKPNHAGRPTPVDMMAKLQGSAGPSSKDEDTKAAGRNDANDSGRSKDHNHVMVNLTRALVEYTGSDEAGSLRLPPAATLPPLTKGCDEASARPKHRDFGLTQDDIASAILKLALQTHPDNCPIPPVELSKNPPEIPAILGAGPASGHPENILAQPVKPTGGWSTVLRLSAVVGTIVVFWTFVPPSTRQEVDAADNALPAKVTDLPSKFGAAVPLPVSRPAYTSGSAQQTEAAPRTIPPPAAAGPLRVEKSGTNRVPVPDLHEPQGTTADLSEAKEIAGLVNRGMESLKSDHLQSARLSLQRAVEAIPSPAAVPSLVEPSQSTPLRATSQTLAVKQPSPQNEPPMKSSADVRQAAQVASLEPGVAPVSEQKVPAQEDSTIRRLDPDEIAVLLSRGMDFLKSGDFASARVTLRRAAEAGNAEAALALGSTYDPLVLRQLGAVTIAADVVQAREWYEKAVHFGSAAAAQRLARLVQPAR